jgi:hypothetical protein
MIGRDEARREIRALRRIRTFMDTILKDIERLKTISDKERILEDVRHANGRMAAEADKLEQIFGSSDGEKR